MDHAAKLGTVLVFDGLIQSAEPERLHGPLLVGLLPDHAAHVGDLQARHGQPTGSSTGAAGATGVASASGFLPRRLSRSLSSAGFPRACAALSAGRRARRGADGAPAGVARVCLASR